MRLVLPPAKVLTGRVVDVDGAPVVGLLVTCSTHTPQRAFAGPQVPAQTDADGRFVFEGLADVQVRLTIDGNTGWAPPAPVLVASDANDVTLTVARFGTFEGRLVDDEDRPVAGARLTLHHPRTRELVDAPKGYALKRNWQRTVTTGADGRFLLPMVQPGVRPELHGSLPADRARQFLRLHRETIDPHAGPFELKLERGVSVKGRVRDPKGRPIAGVRIVSRSLDGKDHPDLQHSAASDDEGQYEIGAFPRNAIVKLAFELTPIHRQQHLPWLPVRMDRYEVAGGRTLDVTMREGVSIEGVVLDAKPEDLKGFAFLLQSSTKQRAGWHRFDGTSAEFHFVGLEPGRYTMTVSARPRHNRLLIYQTHEIVAPTKTPFEIVPIVQHRVLGRMVGRSPHGYTATFYNYKGRRMSAGVKADGSFDLGTQVNRPGLLILRSTSEAWFVHRDYTPDGKPLNVEPVEGKPIKGRIRGLPGKLKQGTVTAMRGPLKYRAAVAEDGWFELPPMPLGDWEIHFELRMPKRIKFHLPDFVPAGRTNLVVNLP